MNSLEKLAKDYVEPKSKCDIKQILTRLKPMDPEITEVDRFENDYPRHLRHEDDMASLFIDHIAMEFATEEPVCMHNHVYEKETLYNLFLHHLSQKDELYSSFFKDRITDKLVWLDGSTAIYDLSDHKEDIRKMQIGYLERKEMRDIYLAKVRESSKVAAEIAKNLNAEDKKRKESKGEGHPSLADSIIKTPNVVVKVEKNTESVEPETSQVEPETSLTNHKTSINSNIGVVIVEDKKRKTANVYTDDEDDTLLNYEPFKKINLSNDKIYTDSTLTQCGFTIESKNSSETNITSDITDMASTSAAQKIPIPKNIAESILIESFKETDPKELSNIIGKDGEDLGFHGILKLAEEEGFENTLLNRKSTSWFKKITPFVYDKESRGLLSNHRPIKWEALQRKFNAAVRMTKDNYLTVGKHSSDITGEKDDSQWPEYVPLVQRLLDCKSMEMTISERAESIRKEKRAIEYTVMSPQASLGNTSALQVRNRHETTRTGSNNSDAKREIDRAISASSTQVLSSRNPGDFSLLDHTTSSSTTSKKRHLSSFLKETNEFPNDELKLSSVVNNCVTNLENVVKQLPFGDNDATTTISPEKASTPETMAPSHNNNDRKKFNDRIEDVKYYSTQIKELKDSMDGCEDEEILAELNVTLDLLKKQWKKTNRDLLEMSQDKNNSTPTSSDSN